LAFTDSELASVGGVMICSTESELQSVGGIPLDTMALPIEVPGNCVGVSPIPHLNFPIILVPLPPRKNSCLAVIIQQIA
jgi:hypothetical protein